MRVPVTSKLLLVVMLSLTTACATLGQLKSIVQPPRFEEARDRNAEVRLVGPGIDQPLGGARMRLWTQVTNPNPFGFTLSTLRATLILEGNRAATGDFPLGLPLGAGASTVVPLDLAISFTDVPGLATVVRRAIDGRPVGYRLEGTIGVDVGRLGQPVFGPMDLASGELRVAAER
jgi:Late embryogenesis abundant protein